MPSLRPHFPRVLLVLFLAVAAACGDGSGAKIDPIAPASVAVHETLRIPVTVSNGNAGMTFAVESPELPGIERTVSITGTAASGGEFRFTPLSSAVGTQEFQILLMNGDSEIDREPLVVTVTSAADAAPIFIRPGAGGTYDIERDPCVLFQVEVRDDDSSDIVIAPQGSLPEGAMLRNAGPKQADFEWCPTPDQVGANERWTIGLAADDGDHEPTLLNYVVVLRTGPKEGCPGTGPTVNVMTPGEAERVANQPGYEVVASVSDDMGLRDAPILYYSTSEPDDPTKPDVTEFDQVPFRDDGGVFRARVPSLGLADGAEQRVWFVVTATDNDDTTGTLCDHRTDSELRTFVALGGSAVAGLGTCDSCSSSADCESGLCATAAGGARCIPSCAGGGGCGSGTCGSRTTVEGGVSQGCGAVSTVCGGGGGSGSCTDDGYEPNDSLADPAIGVDLGDGQICANDDDYYSITASSGTSLSVTVDGFVHADGDLDLQLLNRGGTILASSAGVTNTETVSYCVPAATEVYARVFGYAGSENRYAMRIGRTPGTCCLDDGFEDDDTRTGARLISGMDFDGTICPGDDDFIRFNVTTPTRVTVSLVLDGAIGDLDLELYGPTGTVVASSRGTTDTETIDRDIYDTGAYTVRVYGWREATGDYLGEVRFGAFSGCVSSASCAINQVCSMGSCGADSCTSSSSCPTDHICPDPGPGTSSSHCGESCTVNADCKAAEACKWFPEGRYCGLRGPQLNGQNCGSFIDCGGQRACLPYPGGYCARAGCETNSDCETGTFCVPGPGGTNVCAVDCWSADEICRLSSGYACDVERDLDGFLQFVCLPG